MTTSQQPRMYAFWKYDLPPHVLGGEGYLLPNGDFKADGYGGAKFLRKNIVAVTTIETGKAQHQRIKDIDGVRRTKNKARDDAANVKIQAILLELNQ